MATAALFGGLAALGCTEDEAGKKSPKDVTYQGSTRAIFEKQCTVCHNPEGIGPMSLTTFADVKKHGPAVLAAVESGHMPPFLPSTECRHYEGERALSSEEKDALKQWVSQGSQEGSPSEYVAPAPPPAPDYGSPDLEIWPEAPYLPSGQDPHRCYPLQHTFEEDTYLTMTNVVPGTPHLVHHLLVFMAEPEYVAQIEALDAADPEIGYSCVDSPATGVLQNIAGWAPGNRPLPLSAPFVVRKGSKLVMQVHYDLFNRQAEVDHTKVQLWTTQGEPPSTVSRIMQFLHIGLEIEPGDANSLQKRVFRNLTGKPWTGNAALGHMHYRGKAVRMKAVHADGSETCLLDIPRWSSHWGDTFRFRGDETVTIMPGESLVLECEFDNSAENQPNGKPPGLIHWGTSAVDDEMCLGYFVVTTEREIPSLTESCPSFQGCYDKCKASGSTAQMVCMLQCGQASGDVCRKCVVPATVQCNVAQCGKPAGDMLECLEGCQTEPDPKACVSAMCLGKVISFDTCAKPKLGSDGCDSYLKACGVDP